MAGQPRVRCGELQGCNYKHISSFGNRTQLQPVERQTGQIFGKIALYGEHTEKDQSLFRLYIYWQFSHNAQRRNITCKLILFSSAHSEVVEFTANLCKCNVAIKNTWQIR